MTDSSDGAVVALAKSAYAGVGPKGTPTRTPSTCFAAASPAQKIVYNENSGWLKWYEDGSHTTDPVAFAKIGKHLDFLDHSDIMVI